MSCHSPSLFTPINNSYDKFDNSDNVISFKQLRSDVFSL